MRKEWETRQRARDCGRDEKPSLRLILHFRFCTASINSKAQATVPAKKSVQAKANHLSNLVDRWIDRSIDPSILPPAHSSTHPPSLSIEMTIANRSSRLVAFACVIASAVVTAVLLFAPFPPRQVDFYLVNSTATAAAATTVASFTTSYPYSTLCYPEYRGTAQQTPLALVGANKSPPYPHDPNEGYGRDQVSPPVSGDMPARGECGNCATVPIPDATSYFLIPTRVGPIVKFWVLIVALLLLVVALVAALRLFVVTHRTVSLDDGTQHSSLQREIVDSSETTLKMDAANTDASNPKGHGLYKPGGPQRTNQPARRLVYIGHTHLASFVSLILSARSSKVRS